MLHWRKIHRKIAPLIFLPLLLAALTGIAYRVGRNWLQIPKTTGESILAIHTGQYLGYSLVPFYVLLMVMGLLGAIATGATILLKKGSSRTWRPLHRQIAIFSMIPLAITAITGIGFQLGQSWFGWPRSTTALLLQIHQGSYLGNIGRVWYVLAIGLALLILLTTGIYLTGIGRKKSTPPVA